jgi:nitroreductase
VSGLSFFDVVESTRAIKRLREDPVPLELIRRVIAIGTKAPSGVNTQPWEFLVVRDAPAKRWIQRRYVRFAIERFATELGALENVDTAHARMLRTVMHLAEHLHEVPVLLFVCGHRDWPAAVPVDQRVGLAPPPYGSVYPCAQNMLLACRALGLGASLTTSHHMFESELAQYLGVPDGVSLVALLPIGFPIGRFGPVTRRPGSEITHFDRWDNSEPEPVRAVAYQDKGSGS